MIQTIQDWMISPSGILIGCFLFVFCIAVIIASLMDLAIKAWVNRGYSDNK